MRTAEQREWEASSAVHGPRFAGGGDGPAVRLVAFGAVPLSAAVSETARTLGWIPYVVDPADLQKEVGIPVLNTKAIGINFAEMCVRTGMSHSPVTYPSGRLRYEDFTAHAYD